MYNRLTKPTQVFFKSFLYRLQVKILVLRKKGAMVIHSTIFLPI